ncbi:hypothetical protein [Cohnella sp. LGH]|uniref:hypothetical protein n=1 Tax=Cohnella sp. LGH TaxID=1619153 RepID=UPI001FFDF1C4|nr:hypothetical protein [Cohnella sp. LGH]
MKVQLPKRIFTSILTAILLAIVASLIVMNDSYGFGFYVIAFLTYGTLPVLFIGLPFSILIDWLMARMQFKNKPLVWGAYAVCYAGAGLAGAWLYLLVLTDWDFASFASREVGFFSIFGVLAALLFAGLHWIVNLLFRGNLQS